MRFHVDIDQVTDGRPEGRLRAARDESDTPFAGWVELLRLMEQHCNAAVDGDAEVDTRPAMHR